MTTKELLARAGISEATLRRWLRDGQPVPELTECEQDWRGWHNWEQRHVDAIRRYKELKLREHTGGNGAPAAASTKDNRRQRGRDSEGAR